MFSLYNSACIYVFRKPQAAEECWEWEGWPSLGKSSPIGCPGPKGFLILNHFGCVCVCGGGYWSPSNLPNAKVLVLVLMRVWTLGSPAIGSLCIGYGRRSLEGRSKLLVSGCGSCSLASLPSGSLCFVCAVAGVTSPCSPLLGLSPGITSQENSPINCF